MPKSTIPAAATGLPDPIFAAIERHRSAEQTLTEAARRADKVIALEKREGPSDAEIATCNKALEADCKAFADFCQTVPLTPAGVLAMIAHARKYWIDGPSDENLAAVFDTLTKSPALKGGSNA